VRGSTGVRRRDPAGGNEVTTSGSWRLFSARSMAATTARGAIESMGLEKIRLASRRQIGHATDFGGAPTRPFTSNPPSCSHRYSKTAIRRQFAALGTCMPCLTWWGLPLADGAMSKSKIRRGM